MSFKTSKQVAHSVPIEDEMNADENKLSAHFTLEELAVTNNKKYKESNLAYAKTLRYKLEDLADFLEEVRAVVGAPLLITSGVRSPELNKAVGGAEKSQHMRGEAVDMIPQGKETTESVFCKIFNSHLIFDQLILENSKGKVWIHISYKSMAGRREALVFDGKKYVRYKG
jgi:hypothetical protein